MADREWIRDRPLEKFSDIVSPTEYRKHGIRRHLPAVMPYRQGAPTEELEMRREVDRRFRIKRAMSDEE